jgi:MFS family permease
VNGRVNRSVVSGKPRLFYGYYIVIVSFFLQAVGWGIYNSLGVFFNPLMDEFGWSRAMMASTVSLGMLVFGAAGIIQGRLSDRYGPRIIMTVCGMLMGIGFILLSRVSAFWHMYLFLSLVTGVGMSGTDVVLLSTTTRWFVKARGMMVGIVKVGTGLGMLVMPIVMNRLISSYGWRMTFVYLGLLCLVFYFVGSQFLVRDPALKGVAPDGLDDKAYLGGMVSEEGLSLREASGTTTFWIICFIYFIILFCTATILIHIVPHAIDLKISSAGAAAVLSTLGAFSIAGRFVMGRADDKIGARKALVVSYFFMTVALLWLQISTKLWMLYLFAVIQGFAHGGFFALVAPTVAEFFGTRSHGVIMGVVTFVFMLGGSTGPVLAGYMFDVTGSYQTMFLGITGLCILGLAAALFLRPVRSRLIVSATK